MRKKIGLLGICLLASGCGQLALAPQTDAVDGDGQLRPQSRPEALDTTARRPPQTARTIDEFDTTSAEERRAASAPVAVVAETALGVTIVSLGDPARPGFWLETSLVTTPGTGRVEYPETGKTVKVDLIPGDGGSRMSLPAMRLIEVPLTGLVEVQVFSDG